DWLQVPQRRRAKIDDNCVQSKTADLDARIHAAIKTKNLEVIDSLWNKIKTMRQTGLEKNGEFGCENIAYKLLRNKGCIADLIAAKTAARDQELSLNTRPRERKTVNYGMRDYWYPGTAYAGQDHPAGTEAEQVDESTDPDQLKKILNRFYSSCVSKLQLENPPELRLETTPEWSQENGSFGQYDSDSNTLILATAGRHVLDILRTMAHEMTHRQQDEREPLPIDAGATGSPWEDQANAMAGRIMRDWADEQPEMFDGVTLEEASGYIPTRKQARDPRFVMALTRDVQPGAVGREANKLGLKTDANGKPALLMKSANTLAESLAQELALFEEQDLFEINMGSKNLRKEAAKTGALAGMEFEMIVPNTETDEYQDQEPDYDQDEKASSPSDIRDFFYDNDFNSRRDIDRLIDSMWDDYSQWQGKAFGDRWYSDSESFIYDYIKENMDDDEVRELLELEPDQDITRKEYQLAADKIASEQLQPWYLDAETDARDQFFEDDQFEEWLADADLDTMSGIARNYDIQWPHYTSSGGGSTSIANVAEDFSDAIGRPVNASDRYHGGRREAGRYVVEPDGSLDPDSDDDQGLEFVSPPLPIDEMLSDLNKVRAWADRTGCYTNDSTGLHINVSVPGFSQEKLDFVKLAVLLGDERVLENFGRAGNTYAKSAMKIVKDNIRSNPGPAAALLTKMKANMDSLATKAIHSGTTAKYTSINTKDGYVEFRSPGGDWLGDNFDLIEPTLLRFVVALDAAIDPEKYRQEYQKKLYKLLTADNKDDSTIRYFVDYVAGKIPKAALRSFVKQAQLERGLKKNPVPEPVAASGPRQRYVVKNAAGTPVTRVVASDADTARVLANRWLRQNNPGINTDEFSVEPETELGAPVAGSTMDLQRQRQAAAAPSPIPGVQDIDIDIPIAPPRGNWNGQWRVVDGNTGQELHRFGGIGNSQADANRIAGEWVRTNSISVPTEVYPVLSEGRTQEDYDPSNPPGPESPPQMPAGTIKVDVSDMYDWYKLGQNISNLKSIDKSTLGKGPPSTVFAFGSEELENMYSHALTRLGLKTHDLDEPGEEDVDEQVVNELKINNASGIGAVPNNQQIGYQGLQVVMRPSMFLELALPLDAKSADERETIEYIKKNLDEKGVGAPWLTVVVPEAWESEDFSQMAHVSNHDGRHRMHSILEQEGNDPVEVHIIVPHMRRRHITDAMVDQLRSGVLNQQGQYVSGPVFGAAR
uniref:amidoligase family protein n=1 Tax=Haliscomenobacter sp. TaxID=2717303 RepID=UPI003364FD01